MIRCVRIARIAVRLECGGEWIVEGDVVSVAEEDLGHLEHHSQDRRPREPGLDVAAVEGEFVRDVDADAGVAAGRVPERDRGGGRVDAAV